MANCIAGVHKEPESDFGVSFPDFPGYIPTGKNIDEARDMAKIALTLPPSGHEFLPYLSRLKKIMADPVFAIL